MDCNSLISKYPYPVRSVFCNAWLLLEFGMRRLASPALNQFVGDLAAALNSVDTGPMRLALFGRTRGRGTKVQDWPDVKYMISHKRRVPVAVVVVKSRLLDVTKSLETTPEENLLMARETIASLHDHGLEVMVDFEHAMDAVCGRRGENGVLCAIPYFIARSRDYFHQITDQCVAQQKVSRLVMCDTTGGAGPEEVTQLFADLTRTYPDTSFGFHGHTDRGLGIANTRAAIFAGAVQVQGDCARHRRALRQRQLDHGCRRHAGARRSRNSCLRHRSLGLPDLLIPRMQRSGWRRRTGYRSLVRGLSAPGQACTAAASTRIRARICGAIPPW